MLNKELAGTINNNVNTSRLVDAKHTVLHPRAPILYYLIYRIDLGSFYG